MSAVFCVQARDGRFAPLMIGPGLLIISASLAVPIGWPNTAFAVRHLTSLLYGDGLPPPGFSSSTRSNVCRVQSAPRGEEKAVQEGRGKRRALSASHHTPVRATETLPLRRRSPPPCHLPSLPTCCACGWLLISCFLSRPFGRKSNPNWPPNLPPLRLAYPPVRNVQPNTLLRKEQLPHSVPLPPLLFRRTSLSLKQASTVPPNEWIASWSSMTREV
jgi:hypothetical protein